MHISKIVFAAAVIALAACSDLSSGGGMTPPVTQGVQPNPSVGAAARPGAHNAPAASPTPSAPPGDKVTYSLDAMSGGVRCPDVDGYSCILHLNVPPASPSPHEARRASPSPSPTPTPTPTPSPSQSTRPSPTPTATPSITLQLEAKPHDAPAMVNEDSTLAPVPLVALHATASEDIVLHGGASIDFILPQGELGGRNFAVQLFDETTQRHNRHHDAFAGSYSHSTSNGTTLHFEIAPPAVTFKRGETWLLVLYASDVPRATPSPSASPPPSPSPSPSPPTLR
ncbi:MAG: hypothetical protein ACREMP_08940 [Candidatus Tyrphobacter sp.]